MSTSSVWILQCYVSKHEQETFLTVEASLEAAPSPVPPLRCTPPTLRPGDALGTLGELGALWSARIPP